jgi:methionyl aminopeptidase
MRTQSPNSLVKSKNEIETMRKAGRILATIMDEMEAMVVPDLDVYELENKFIDLCKKNNVVPACKGYPDRDGNPFPTGLCVAINEQAVHCAVHCVPQKGEIAKEEDILKIDTIIGLDGLHVDHAKTFAVGKVSDEREKLINTTKMALEAATNVIRAGAYVGDIGNAIYTVVEMAGFDVLREYTGHGIGEGLHEEPAIFCYGEKGEGMMLEQGMTLAIEPLVCTGNFKVENVGSSWETKMADDSDFAQFEHTVVVKKDKAEILTKN